MRVGQPTSARRSSPLPAVLRGCSEAICCGSSADSTHDGPEPRGSGTAFHIRLRCLATQMAVQAG